MQGGNDDLGSHGASSLRWNVTNEDREVHLGCHGMAAYPEYDNSARAPRLPCGRACRNCRALPTLLRHGRRRRYRGAPVTGGV